MRAFRADFYFVQRHASCSRAGVLTDFGARAGGHGPWIQGALLVWSDGRVSRRVVVDLLVRGAAFSRCTRLLPLGLVHQGVAV